MSVAAFRTTVLNSAALINHTIILLNERRGLNIHLIFLYAAPRLSNLLEWAPRRSHVYISFIYTQRCGSHHECRGVRTNTDFIRFVNNPNSIKLTSKHPRLVNMTNLNKTKTSFHAINPLNKIYH